MNNYGLFKQAAADNHYVSLTKALNSAFCTENTQKTMKRITASNIKYAHMGQLIIHEGICYSSFLQNPGDDGEGHDSLTSGVVLAVFPLKKAISDDFDADRDITFYPIGSKGDFCAGVKACSIFKDNSMCLVGNLLHICFCFIGEDGRSHMFCKVFNILTENWERENAISLRYNGKLYDFSDETINIVYQDKGLLPRAEGLIELVSAWSEYRGEYYATGVTIEQPNNGIVVKTADFVTMELVDAVPFNDMGSAEIASCIFKNRLYVACRQGYGIPYLYVSFLDLTTMEWKNHYRLADGNVRPWFFAHKDELYLLNTIEEKTRTYTNISRVRVWETEYDFFNDHCPVDTIATLKDCGCYFATANDSDDVYFVCTRVTENFSKLCLDFFDPDEVNDKLLSLFS